MCSVTASAGRRDKKLEVPDAIDITPVASASEIPALADLLAKAGWTPTPELSGAFEAGAIFSVTSQGHQVALRTCFADPPDQHTYTQAEVMTQLQAGVSVDIGLGSVGGSVGIVKKVKFGTPTHYALPSLKMVPTEECQQDLSRAASMGQDTSTMYVVKEALFAEIAEQTCGTIDASGRFVGLGEAEAELAMACAQVSLEPVAVAFRTVPVDDLMPSGTSNVVVPGGPSGTVVTPGGFSSTLDVSTALADQACQETAQELAHAQHSAKVEEAAAATVEEATTYSEGLLRLYTKTNSQGVNPGVTEEDLARVRSLPEVAVVCPSLMLMLDGFNLEDDPLSFMVPKPIVQGLPVEHLKALRQGGSRLLAEVLPT